MGKPSTTWRIFGVLDRLETEVNLMFGKYKPLWGKKPALNSSYDVVIIGGGLHGLAAAY